MGRGVEWTEDLPCVAACPPTERGVLAHQLETGFGCVNTSSMGRLFDAVSSLAGLRHCVDFEAEAAIELESRARGVLDAEPYAFGPPADPGPVIRAVADDVRHGVEVATIAARFHAAVAALVRDLARHERERSGLDVVALGGGVFQNALLLASTIRLLDDAGFEVLRPRLLPPHDGGLALGQILVGSVG